MGIPSLSTTYPSFVLRTFLLLLLNSKVYFIYFFFETKMTQLPADCLNEILKYLENEKTALRSCLLVNLLWCEIAVRILWRNVRNYSSTNIRTLIACLPDESKEMLRTSNGIVILTPTSKLPMFNYASFCKVLSINHVNYLIKKLLKNQLSIPGTIDSSTRANIVEHELHKLFMNQISSLKELTYLQ